MYRTHCTLNFFAIHLLRLFVYTDGQVLINCCSELANPLICGLLHIIGRASSYQMSEKILLLGLLLKKSVALYATQLDNKVSKRLYCCSRIILALDLLATLVAGRAMLCTSPMCLTELLCTAH
jgi:hypothetical protein